MSDFDLALSAIQRAAEIQAEALFRVSEKHGRDLDLAVARVTAFKSVPGNAELTELVRAVAGNPT